MEECLLGSASTAPHLEAHCASREVAALDSPLSSMPQQEVLVCQPALFFTQPKREHFIAVSLYQVDQIHSTVHEPTTDALLKTQCGTVQALLHSYHWIQQCTWPK